MRLPVSATRSPPPHAARQGRPLFPRRTGGRAGVGGNRTAGRRCAAARVRQRACGSGRGAESAAAGDDGRNRARATRPESTGDSGASGDLTASAGATPAPRRRWRGGRGATRRGLPLGRRERGGRRDKGTKGTRRPPTSDGRFRRGCERPPPGGPGRSRSDPALPFLERPMKVQGDRLARLVEALDVLRDHADNVRLVRVLSATTRRPRQEQGDFYYLLSPLAAPRGRRPAWRTR